jgi:tRNA threonylcarbamoyladenosine biosynthesis protein TsaE
MMEIIDLPNHQATLDLGYSLSSSLSSGTIVLLDGELGTGKTTLVQGIGQGLGIQEAIVSPTFTIICEYFEGRIPLYHLDLYRLNSKEVESLHLESYWDGQEVIPGIMAIEWSDRLKCLPSNPILHIKLFHTEDFSRKATLAYSKRK